MFEKGHIYIYIYLYGEKKHISRAGKVPVSLRGWQ